MWIIRDQMNPINKLVYCAIYSIRRLFSTSLAPWFCFSPPAQRGFALLHEKRTHGIFVTDPEHRFCEQACHAQLLYALTRLGILPQRNGVGDNELVQGRVPDPLHG